MTPRPRRMGPEGAGEGQVLSLTVSVTPFVLTLAMPLSREDSLEYIWLVPMTCWLAAFRLKNSMPSDAVLRSYLASSAQFACTDAMPPLAESLAAYCWLVRIVCVLSAFNTKRN